MKKQMLLLIILILALAACSSPADAALTPVPSSTPAPTATPTPGPLPDTDIPDVRFDTGDYASTENELSEDDKYVYYGDLLCASKENNRTTRILSIYRDWTLCNGMICYAKYAGTDSDGGDAITEYDPQTGKTKDIYKAKGAICNIIIYKGLIYFTIVNNGHHTEDIWAVKLDGSGAKRVTKDEGTIIDSFCIYKDAIYYTSSESLYKCTLDGSGNQKLFDNAWTRFQIYNGKLSFHAQHINKMLDLNTGAEITVDIPDTYYSSVLWGQYILYINDTKLYAFDYNTGKTYYMMDLGGYDAELISAQSGSADIRLWGRDGNHLSRIIIKDGKASLSDIIYTPSAARPEDTVRVDYSSKLGDGRKVVIEPGVAYIGGNGNVYKGLEIECKEGVYLTIEGLSIDNSGSDNACALSFFGEGNYLILGNGNDLTSGCGQPGIRVEEGTELTIEGGGELKVRGGNGGAGIGGRANDIGKIKQDYRTRISSGSITINSGTIYAYSGGNAACIGGGQYGNGGGIEILGGDIYLGEETNKYMSMALGYGNPDFQAGEDPELTRHVMIFGGNVTIQNCYGLLGYKEVDANDIFINGKANVSVLGEEKADTGLAVVMERNAYFYYNAGRGYPKPHTTIHHYAQIKLYDSNDYSHIEGGSYPLYIVNSAGERRRVMQMSDKKVISVYLPEDTYHIEYEGETSGEGKPPQKTEWFEVKKDTQVSLHLPSAKKTDVYCAAIRIGYRFVFTDFPDKSGKKAPVYIVDDKGKRWEIQRVSNDNVAAAFLPKGRYYIEYNGGPLLKSDWFEVNGDTQLSLDLRPTTPDIYGIYCDGTQMRFGASEEGDRMYNTDYTVGQGHSVDLDIRHGYETQVFVNGKAWGLVEGPVEVKPGKDSIVIEAVSGDGRTKVVYTINTTSETAGTNKIITLQNPDASQRNTCVSADRNFAFTDDYIFYTILYGRTNPAHVDLYRYDRKTGERKRIAEIAGHIAAAEDKVFFARGSWLYCVNADGSGEELIAHAGYGIRHIFAIGGKVYFGDKSRYESDNILYVYDIRDKSLKSIAMDCGPYAVRSMNGGIYIYTEVKGRPIRSYLLDERTNTLVRQDEPVYMELNGYKAVSKEKGHCSIINGTGDTVAEFEDDAPEESIARYYQYIIYCPDKEKLRALNTNTGEISCLGNVSGDFIEFFEADGKLYAYFALGNLKEDDPEEYDAVLLEEISIENNGLVMREVIKHKTWDADPPLNAELAPEVYDYYYWAI